MGLSNHLSGLYSARYGNNHLEFNKTKQDELKNSLTTDNESAVNAMEGANPEPAPQIPADDVLDMMDAIAKAQNTFNQ